MEDEDFREFFKALKGLSPDGDRDDNPQQGYNAPGVDNSCNG